MSNNDNDNDNDNIQNDEIPPTEKLVASRAMCYCCFDTLIDALKHPNRQHASSSGSKSTKNFSGRSREVSSPNHNTNFINELSDDSVECPIFITWEKCFNSNNNNNASSSPSWQLRGCIGNLSPRLLATAVEEYAMISAFNDRRFKPIKKTEMHSLRVAVSLLVKYEICKDVYDWTIGVHGILIKFVVNGQHYDGTFLPEVSKQQRWDHTKTISSLIKKAGHDGTITQELLTSIDCTRYQSSKCISTYTEYVNDKCKGIDPIFSTIPPPPTTATSNNNKKATTSSSRPWPFFNMNR
jgi:uncharacterized protein (TIGR00296 family)